MNYFFYILILIAICYPLSPVSAQWFFSIESGYGFATRSDNFEYSTCRIDLSHEQRLISRNKFGQGVNFGFSSEYKFNPNMALGIDFSFLNGNSFLLFSKGYDISSPYTVFRYKAEMLRIIPKVCFSLPLNKWSFFSEIGLIAGIGQFTEEDTSIQKANDMTYIFYSKRLYKGGLSLGIMNSLGVLYNLNEKVALSIAFQSYTQSYGPTKSEKVAISTNGTSNLENLNTSQIYTIYKNSFLFPKQWSPPDPSIPAVDIREYYSFSSMGLSIRLIYNIR